MKLIMLIILTMLISSVSSAVSVCTPRVALSGGKPLIRAYFELDTADLKTVDMLREAFKLDPDMITNDNDTNYVSYNNPEKTLILQEVTEATLVPFMIFQSINTEAISLFYSQSIEKPRSRNCRLTGLTVNAFIDFLKKYKNNSKATLSDHLTISKAGIGDLSHNIFKVGNSFKCSEFLSANSSYENFCYTTFPLL